MKHLAFEHFVQSFVVVYPTRMETTETLRGWVKDRTFSGNGRESLGARQGHGWEVLGVLGVLITATLSICAACHLTGDNIV